MFKMRKPKIKQEGLQELVEKVTRLESELRTFEDYVAGRLVFKTDLDLCNLQWATRNGYRIQTYAVKVAGFRCGEFVLKEVNDTHGDAYKVLATPISGFDIVDGVLSLDCGTCTSLEALGTIMNNIRPPEL